MSSVPAAEAAEAAEAAPPAAAVLVRTVPRIHFAGDGGIYLDCGGADIDIGVQRRLWAMARTLREAAQVDGIRGIREVVPGVNNLLVLIDPLVADPVLMREHILALWRDAAPVEIEARVLEIPVVYGGEGGGDLREQATRTGLSVHDYVAAHSDAHYQVMCIGSSPGFSYMCGLPPLLHAPRRSVPRLRIPGGSVVIGGVQAGVMPDAGPSGWHILGHTPLRMFDATREPACLLAPGDTVRFVATAVLA